LEAEVVTDLDWKWTKHCTHDSEAVC
jgi:hypothetical protein